MNYSLIDGKVAREDGFIAVQHRTSNPTAIKVNGNIYNFVAKHNVSMAWISPADIDKVLGEMARICCGQKGKKFFLASLINTNLHEVGTRDGQ